jgi:Tol biopolymer transport system component
MPFTGGAPRPFLARGAAAPAWSPDGTRLAYMNLSRGTDELLVADGTGADARQLIAPEPQVHNHNPVWSPDARWIYFVLGSNPTSGVDGGEPERLVEEPAFNPVWSPDGDLIVYTEAVAGSVPLVGVRPDGAAAELPTVTVRPGGYRFVPDGSGLAYLPHLLSSDFWLLDFATGTSRPLTRLSRSGALRTFDISPDGTHLVFDRSLEHSDVVLIELTDQP